MIRQCYNQRVLSNKEIAEYCSCDVRDVYFAVKNESNDNLDEDQDYLDGKLGDIVNIDDFARALEGNGEDRDVFHVDEKIEMDMDAVVEDEPMEEVASPRAESRAEAYPTPESDAPPQPEEGEDASIASEDEVERDCK